MPDSSTTCILPDGTTLDLSTATAAEASACLAESGGVLHLGGIEDEQPAAPPSPVTRKRMDPKPVQDEPAVDAPPPAAESTAVAPVSAHEEQPEAPAPATASSEIADLMQSTGGGALGLVAALIAVVGGTAGFKLWTKISEQKHEQQMKRLDIEQANAGLGGAQPPPCQAAHHTLVADIKALQARVSALEGRLEKAEKAAAGFDPSVDVGDLEDRVEVLEKALRKKARAAEGTH